MLSAIHIVGFLNQAFVQIKSIKQPHFLHVDMNLQKLKVDWKVFGGAWSKMSVANLFSGMKPFFYIMFNSFVKIFSFDVNYEDIGISIAQILFLDVIIQEFIHLNGTQVLNGKI